MCCGIKPLLNIYRRFIVSESHVHKQWLKKILKNNLTGRVAVKKTFLMKGNG